MPRVAVAWGSAQTQPWVREVFRLTSRVFPSSWHPPPICSCPPFNLSAILGHPMSAVSAPLSPGPLLTSVTCWPLEVCLPWAWWWEGRGDRDALAPGARRLVGAHSSGSCRVSWKRVWRVGPLGRSGPLPGGGDANLDMALSSPPFCPREAPKRLLGGALVQPCLFLEDSPQRHAPPGRLPIAGKPLVCSGGGAPPAPPDPRELCQHRGCCEKEGASEGTRGRPGLPEPSLGPALRQRDGLRLPWPGRRAGPFGSPCRGGGGALFDSQIIEPRVACTAPLPLSAWLGGSVAGPHRSPLANGASGFLTWRVAVETEAVGGNSMWDPRCGRPLSDGASSRLRF